MKLKEFFMRNEIVENCKIVCLNESYWEYEVWEKLNKKVVDYEKGKISWNEFIKFVRKNICDSCDLDYYIEDMIDLKEVRYSVKKYDLGIFDNEKLWIDNWKELFDVEEFERIKKEKRMNEEKVRKMDLEGDYDYKKK